jgi:hypothetical protein
MAAVSNDRKTTIMGNLEDIFREKGAILIEAATAPNTDTDVHLMKIAKVLSDKYFDPVAFSEVVDSHKTVETMDANLESDDTIAPSCAGADIDGCPRDKLHHILLKKYRGKIKIKRHETPEKTETGEGRPIELSAPNVRLLWSGFKEGAQYVATLFGVLFTIFLGVGRAIEQIAATQDATDEIGNWAEANAVFPAFFGNYGLNGDHSYQILVKLWDDFSSKFAGMAGFDITMFFCPLSMEDRLDATTFYREELPALNTKYFAVILYDIKSNGEIILYNVVFEGDGAIQVIKLDGTGTSPGEINIMVGQFSNDDRERIKDFLTSVSRVPGVDQRPDSLSELLSLSSARVQDGGRRKYKRKRRSKTKKKSKRRKSKRHKYKKKRNTKRKSKSK